MQRPNSSLGVVFDTALASISDVLSIAMLFGMQQQSQAQFLSLTLTGGNLKAAAFCDGLMHYYNRFRPLPVGLALEGKLQEDAPMFTKPLARAEFPTTVKKINDTAEPEPAIRNALTSVADQNAVIVSTGPTSTLERMLTLRGARDLVKSKVRLLVLAGDVPAPAGWPSPVATCGPEVGEALKFPGESIEKDFAYMENHPIAEAYRAFHALPYDAPATSMAAVMYAVRPGDFELTPARAVSVVEAKRHDIIAAYTKFACVRPVTVRMRPPA